MARPALRVLSLTRRLGGVSGGGVGFGAPPAAAAAVQLPFQPLLRELHALVLCRQHHLAELKHKARSSVILSVCLA